MREEMNTVLTAVLQLRSYGGFLNLSLGDGGSDSAQCDLVLEVRGRGSAGVGLPLCRRPVIESLTPPPTHFSPPHRETGDASASPPLLPRSPAALSP